MALELPIDCTRIPIRHLFPGGMPFHASVFESLQKIFSANHTGAPAYATLLELLNIIFIYSINPLNLMYVLINSAVSSRFSRVVLMGKS